MCVFFLSLSYTYICIHGFLWVSENFFPTCRKSHCCNCPSFIYVAVIKQLDQKQHGGIEFNSFSLQSVISGSQGRILKHPVCCQELKEDKHLDPYLLA